MSHSITINVSDSLYKKLRRAALLFHRPAETIILDSLQHTLPPLFEEIPAEYQDNVFPLLAMNDHELKNEANRTFPREHWPAYESLLERKKTAGLTSDEEQTLNTDFHNWPNHHNLTKTTTWLGFSMHRPIELRIVFVSVF